MKKTVQGDVNSEQTVQGDVNSEQTVQGDVNSGKKLINGTLTFKNCPGGVNRNVNSDILSRGTLKVEIYPGGRYQWKTIQGDITNVNIVQGNATCNSKKNVMGNVNSETNIKGNVIIVKTVNCEKVKWNICLG